MIMTYLEILLNKQYTAQPTNRVCSEICGESNYHNLVIDL